MRLTAVKSLHRSAVALADPLVSRHFVLTKMTFLPPLSTSVARRSDRASTTYTKQDGQSPSAAAKGGAARWAPGRHAAFTRTGALSARRGATPDGLAARRRRFRPPR